MSSTQHSPLPWKWEPQQDDYNDLVDANGNELWVKENGFCVIGDDDAAFIVEAVNSHDRLVAENEKLRAALEKIAYNADAHLIETRIIAEQALKGE